MEELDNEREFCRRESKMVSLPEYGDHMTIKDWLDCVGWGGFTDYDGFGCYATETEMLDDGRLYHLIPSDVKDGKIYTYDYNPKWTHIVWFNR